ncbi:MAG: UDP-3-O-acyl-N-acetylglucosamine deacetylase [Proteobacteria bacterium]|nr:UDP-3-O-acyl-N-acetylglucosamine deacetylase [Pseudomonadota bacterium]
MALHIEPYQHTLQRPVSCCGVGLHTGRTVNLTINPAPVNTGIQFLRSDLAGCPVIPARVERVASTALATTIGEGSSIVATTEHLLAALRGCGVDNAVIDLDSHEVPIMDGSAGPFVRLLKNVGLSRQQALRKMLRITRPISLTDADKSIRIEPYDGYKVTARIQFDDALINEQRYSVEVTPEKFGREIARARTFGFVEQVEQLWQNGLALGSTLDNVIAIHWNRQSVLNEDGLRFDDEFIRHKVLDIIGDMALLGSPLLGHVVADRSGHGLHRAFMQAIIDNPQSWEYVTFKQQGASLCRQTVRSSRDSAPRFAPFFAPVGEVMNFLPACAA